MPAMRGTRERLLDLAQELVQTRGLDGFSFRDLADGVGIRSASVHHHFATKEDLVRELMARYRAEFLASLARIDGHGRSARRKLEEFAELFRDVLRQGERLCLCGRLAADYPALPRPVQAEVRAFFESTEAWLRRTLQEGAESGELRFAGSAEVVARTFLATLEGAMIAARTFDDESRLARAGDWIIAALDAATGGPPPRRATGGAGKGLRGKRNRA